MGHVIWTAGSRGVRVTRWNMRLCFPELSRHEQDKLAYESFLETTVTGVELFWVWTQPPQKVLSYVVDTVGLEGYQACLAAKNGMFLAGPHLGNWEVAGLFCATQGAISSMYAPLKFEALDKLVKKSREATGGSLVPTDLRGVRALLKALKRGEQVGILPDQRAKSGSAGGVFSPFFGQPAYTMSLFTSLKKKAGDNARVFVVFAERVSGGWRIHFQAAPEAIYSDDEQEAIDALNVGVEQAVRQIPAQYQWEYKRFSYQPDGKNPYDPIRHTWPKES